MAIEFIKNEQDLYLFINIFLTIWLILYAIQAIVWICFFILIKLPESKTYNKFCQYLFFRRAHKYKNKYVHGKYRALCVDSHTKELTELGKQLEAKLKKHKLTLVVRDKYSYPPSLYIGQFQ